MGFIFNAFVESIRLKTANNHAPLPKTIHGMAISGDLPLYIRTQTQGNFTRDGTFIQLNHSTLLESVQQSLFSALLAAVGIIAS
jgi:hypothetical protein